MSVVATAKGIWEGWRSPARRPDWARATRATSGFLIPLALNATVGLPVPVVFVSIAAQNIAMLDVRGDYRLRVLLLMGMTALLAGAGALGVLAAGHITVAVAATMAVALGAALWRHVASDYGLLLSASSMLLFLISLATTEGPEDLAAHVSGIGLGGVIGLLLQTALWPFRAQHPLRRAAGDSWVAASALFDALQAGRPAAALEAAERELRVTLDQTTKLLAGASRHRNHRLADRLEELSLRAARLSVRVMAVHTALEGLRGTPVAARIEPALGPVLTSLTNNARSIAVAVVSRQPAHLASCEVRLRRLTTLLETVRARLLGAPVEPGAEMLAGLFERVQATVPEVLERLRATLERTEERALFAAELFDVQTWQLRPLSTALNFSRRVDASLVRFGLRLAVCTGLGTWAYRWWDIPHGYWVPFTVVVVMQPDYGSTRKRAGQRLFGTLAGSVVASGLMWLETGPLLHLAFIGAGVFAFAYHLKRNYAAAVFGATVFVVMLLEHTGEVGSHVQLERIGATLAGGVIALVAAWLFWPMWEHDRFAPVLSGALRATTEYWRELQRRLGTGGALDEPTLRAKRRAEAASVSVFASVGRLFADAHNPRAEIERAATLANGNQRVLRLANLLMVGLRDGPGATSELHDIYFNTIERGLEGLAAGVTALPDPAERAAVMAAFDALPTVDCPTSGDASALVHLARAATEVRAMLAAAGG